MKPVELFSRAIKNSSRGGGIVLDPFLGSGTAIIACEQLGRTGWGIELDPGYVGVSLQRFYDVTGIEPVLTN
jgi:DNA modification methylase